MVLGWFEKHSGISWVITLIGAIAIFYISTLNFGPGTGVTSNLSILYHFFAFFSFALFLQISSLKGQNRYNIFILVVIISILYGISDELHQYFVPWRTCSIFDAGIDTLGILLASMIYLIRIKYIEVTKIYK